MVRRRFFRQLLACLAIVGIVQTNCAFAQRHSETRVLFLGPSRPAIFEIEFLAGRYSIEEMRRQYAQAVFKQLDLDESGSLQPDEAAQIPREGRLRVGVERLNDDWTSLDTAPQDGRISFDELADHLQAALGPPLTIEQAPPRLSATVRLYDDLDLNGDGKIAADEVEQGLEILRSFDFDDDETLSVAELQPFPLSVVQAQAQARSEEEPAPVYFIRDDAEIDQAIAAFFDYYHAEPPLGRNHLPGLTDREFSRFDLDDDLAWGADDVELFLKRAPADYVLKVSLAPPRVEVVRGQHDGARRPTIEVGGLPLRLVARSKIYQQFDATRLYLVRFIQSDADKNGYLDPMEFAGLQAPDVAFEHVDLDANEQVTRDEIKFFFTMDGLAAQSRLVLRLSNETKTLFDVLDEHEDVERIDRRLTPREFAQGRERLLAHDVNRDGALSADEFSSEFQLEFTQPQLFETDPTRNQNAMMNQRQGRVVRETSGPIWFGRMDDNLDGELSWREFLGPREIFDQLDLNDDGFLDSSEAQAAESNRDAELSATP